MYRRRDLLDENDPHEILLAVKEFYKDYQSGFTRKQSSSLVLNHSIFRSASDAIFKDLSHPFFTNRPFYISRLMLKNLASKGSLYEF